MIAAKQARIVTLCSADYKHFGLFNRARVISCDLQTNRSQRCSRRLQFACCSDPTSIHYLLRVYGRCSARSRTSLSKAVVNCLRTDPENSCLEATERDGWSHLAE